MGMIASMLTWSPMMVHVGDLAFADGEIFHHAPMNSLGISRNSLSIGSSRFAVWVLSAK